MRASVSLLTILRASSFFAPRSALPSPIVRGIYSRCAPALLSTATSEVDDDTELPDAAEAPRVQSHKGGATQPGTVYYVGTPIGNLEDITLRAIRTLRECDVVASEDTRVTGSLLRHLGIERKRLIAHHDHNLGSSVPKLLGLLRDGASVAVVSDAGTPGISDPGIALAAACAEHNVPLIPIPGPCAAVAAMSVAGLGATTEFVFGGFIARGSKARRSKVEDISSEHRAVVLYEAPHRLLETLGDLAAAGCAARGLVVARELTKLHEEFHRGSVRSAYQHYGAVAERDGKLRGEFTLVLAPLDAAALEARKAGAAAATMEAAAAAVADRLDAGESTSRASKSVAAELGIPKAKVYAEALRQQQERKEQKRAANRQSVAETDLRRGTAKPLLGERGEDQ